MNRQIILSNNSIKLLILILALLYSIYEYSWGIWAVDNYYWIHISNNWRDAPMTTLSLWSMDKWFEVFGRTLIAFRTLAWIINTIIVLLAFMFLLSKEERSRYWYYLCGVFIIMGPGLSKHASPNLTSLLLLFLILCSLSNFRKTHYLTWLMTMGILTAFVIAARFPNIVCIPFVMIYILLSFDKKKKGIAGAMGYLLISLFMYWGLMAVALDTTDIFGKISTAFQHAAGESNERHSMIGLLLRYCKSILLSLVACTILWGIWKMTNKLKGRHTLVRFILPTLTVTFLLFEIYRNIGSGWHSWSVCIAGFLALQLSYCAYQKWKQHNTDEFWRLMFMVFIAFVPSAGSDTGFMNSMILGCALMPYTISKLEQHKVATGNIVMSFVIVMLTSLLIYNERAIYHRYTTDLKPMKYILWEKWQINKCEHLVSSIEPYYKKDSTLFYGLDAHFLYCVTEQDINCNYWMDKNDTIEIGRVVETMKKRNRSVLIDLTKSDTNLFVNRGLRLQTEEKEFNVLFNPD